MTGFTPGVRLLIRTRAGDGDPAAAVCENCGVWLGLHGGQCQHIVARQMGGCVYRNTAGNGVLLCGTPVTLCHGACERRDKALRDRGFWRYSADDPADFPVLHVRYGTVCLNDDGTFTRTARPAA